MQVKDCSEYTRVNRYSWLENQLLQDEKHNEWWLVQPAVIVLAFDGFGDPFLGPFLGYIWEQTSQLIIGHTMDTFFCCETDLGSKKGLRCLPENVGGMNYMISFLHAGADIIYT